MAHIVDSHSESNGTFNELLNATGRSVAQLFTGDGSVLDKSTFYISKQVIISLAGTLVCKIYDASGTVPTAVPTGSPLATSETVDIDDVTTTLTLTDFTFSGANKITLSNGVNYFVAIEITGTFGSGFDTVNVRGDDSTGDPSGNAASNFSGSWSAGFNDYCFYVYGQKDTGWVSPGSASQTNTSFTGDWINVNNALSSNNSYATSGAGGGENTERLLLSNFGFSIPAGSTIDGVEISVEYYTSDADDQLRVSIDNSGSYSTAKTNNTPSTSETTEIYGANNDTFGLTLSAGDVNSSGFGASIELWQNSSGGASISVDHVQMKVYYTEVAGSSTASVSPVTATTNIPSVTATYESVQTAVVSPITLTTTIPTVTAQGNETASYTSPFPAFRA